MGLYYYGARYLDPKYSRWISADPALGEYLPQAPINEESKKHNQSLPGQGGVFNTINLNLYHYAGNNPIKYTDPDGRFVPVVAVAVATAPEWVPVVLEGLAIAGAAVVGIVTGQAVGSKIKEARENEAEQAKQNLKDNAQAAAPVPAPQGDDDNNNKAQSEKDSKKLDNKEADKVSQDKGYNDAHDLKKEYLKGQKDKTMAHYNIYRNSKTGEVFLKHNDSDLVIPVE